MKSLRYILGLFFEKTLEGHYMRFGIFVCYQILSHPFSPDIKTKRPTTK